MHYFLLCVFAGLFAVSATSSPPLRGLQRWRHSPTPLPTPTFGTSPYTTPSALSSFSSLPSMSSSPSLTSSSRPSNSVKPSSLPSSSSRPSNSAKPSPSTSPSPRISKSDSPSPTSFRSPSSFNTAAPYPSSSPSPSTIRSSTTSSSASITSSITPTPTPTNTQPCSDFVKGMGIQSKYCLEAGASSSSNFGGTMTLYVYAYILFIISFLLAWWYFAKRFPERRYGYGSCPCLCDILHRAGVPDTFLGTSFFLPCCCPLFCFITLPHLYWRLWRQEIGAAEAAAAAEKSLQEAIAKAAATAAAKAAAAESAVGAAKERTAKIQREKIENPAPCIICREELPINPMTNKPYNQNELRSLDVYSCSGCMVIYHPECYNLSSPPPLTCPVCKSTIENVRLNLSSFTVAVRDPSSFVGGGAAAPELPPSPLPPHSSSD